MGNATFMLKEDRPLVMIEKGDTRYEFYTMAIYSNQYMQTIVGYRPVIRTCKFLGTGSTWHEIQTSKEAGNAFYKEMLAKGFKRVTERTFA